MHRQAKGSISLSNALTEEVIYSIADGFAGGRFSTLDFVEKLKTLAPAIWSELLTTYGDGGKGVGRHYSAYSRVAHSLQNLLKDQRIFKLDYEPAPEGYGSPVIRYWTTDPNNSGQLFPDEIGEDAGYPEGAATRVTVNKYERSIAARKACIEHHGSSCAACKIDMGKVYGSRGQGFIHVHHLKPLSEIGEKYTVDPIKDLIPVCPNCHAIIHRAEPMLAIEELVELLAGTTD